jgi:ubiquinone/menaquinone biosynthesis C-methylase UbiE
MRISSIAKISVAGGVVAAGGAAYLWRRAMRHETEKLTSILGWRTGESVADVGAGSGHLTFAAARRVGPSGQVFATEVDPRKLTRIRQKASKLGLRNVSVLEAEEGGSGLPSGCCDAILLRVSYHHFTDPAAITGDLYRAARPGGVVAVVDFPPKRWLTLIAPVKGVPANRGGHGIPANVLIHEMTAAGFEVQDSFSWGLLDVYCVVFRKPLEHRMQE